MPCRLLLALLACASHTGTCPPREPECPPSGEDSAAQADTDTPADTGGCDDPAAWYADADADGYGNPSDAVTACEAPAGRVADGSDCDDGDPAIHPGAEEICEDRRDNDCDGRGDEQLDADGDGALPPGLCPHSGADCDDTDASVHPGAEEACGDGVDNDCDGFPVDGDGWYQGHLSVAALLTTFGIERTCTGPLVAFLDPTVSPPTLAAWGTCGPMDFEYEHPWAGLAFSATVEDDGRLTLVDFDMELHNPSTLYTFEGRMDSFIGTFDYLEGSFSTGHSSSGSAYTYLARSSIMAVPCTR